MTKFISKFKSYQQRFLGNHALEVFLSILFPSIHRTAMAFSPTANSEKPQTHAYPKNPQEM